jgi:hypothetical protein
LLFRDGVAHGMVGVKKRYCLCEAMDPDC